MLAPSRSASLANSKRSSILVDDFQGMVARWPLLKEDNLPKKKVSTMSPNTCKECPRSAHVHDLAQLLTVLEEEGSTDVPDSIKEAERLTRFAVFTRYPGAASSCWPGGIRGSATARGRSGRMGRKRAWIWKRFLSARPSLLLLPPEGRKEPLSKKGRASTLPRNVSGGASAVKPRGVTNRSVLHSSAGTESLPSKFFLFVRKPMLLYTVTRGNGQHQTRSND